MNLKYYIAIFATLLAIPTLMGQDDSIVYPMRDVTKTYDDTPKARHSKHFAEYTMTYCYVRNIEPQSLRYSYVPNRWGFYVDVPFAAFASCGAVYRLLPTSAVVDLQVYGGVEMHFGNHYPYKAYGNAMDIGFRIAPGASPKRSAFAWTSMTVGMHFDNRRNAYLTVGMSPVVSGGAAVAVGLLFGAVALSAWIR